MTDLTEIKRIENRLRDNAMLSLTILDSLVKEFMDSTGMGKSFSRSGFNNHVRLGSA